MNKNNIRIRDKDKKKIICIYMYVYAEYILYKLFEIRKKKNFKIIIVKHLQK